MSRDQAVIVTVLATMLGVVIWKLGFALVSTTARKAWRQRECFHHALERGLPERHTPAVSWVNEIIHSGDSPRYRCTRCGKVWEL